MNSWEKYMVAEQIARNRGKMTKANTKKSSMKIIADGTTADTKMKDLAPGDTFRYKNGNSEENVYLVLDEDSEPVIRLVNLATGKVYEEPLDSTKSVIRIECELKYKDVK